VGRPAFLFSAGVVQGVVPFEFYGAVVHTRLWVVYILCFSHLIGKADFANVVESDLSDHLLGDQIT
jgi:hypothetical protein